MFTPWEATVGNLNRRKTAIKTVESSSFVTTKKAFFHGWFFIILSYKNVMYDLMIPWKAGNGLTCEINFAACFSLVKFQLQ